MESTDVQRNDEQDLSLFESHINNFTKTYFEHFVKGV